MGNSLIAFGNYVDTGVLSNGSWLDELPLSNLRDRQLARVARTTGTSTGSSTVDVDVGEGHVVRVVALLNHNIGDGGLYRLRGSDDPTFTTAGYDSASQSVWPAVYPTDQLDWEADNFWLGSYKAEDIAGYPRHLIILLGAPVLLRYWRLEITDVANTDGFIQAGRLFVADGWSPDSGVAFGASIGWEDPSGQQESLSSAKYFDPKPPLRVARITTHFMRTDEAYSKAFEIQRRSGIWKDVVYVHDVDDTIHAIRRRFPARLRALDPLSNPYPDAHETQWEFEEQAP